MEAINLLAAACSDTALSSMTENQVQNSAATDEKLEIDIDMVKADEDEEDLEGSGSDNDNSENIPENIDGDGSIDSDRGQGKLSSRGNWTMEEDEKLRKAVAEFGGRNWKKIAEQIPERTDVQCLHRWQKVLRPGLIKGPWTPEVHYFI